MERTPREDPAAGDQSVPGPDPAAGPPTAPPGTPASGFPEPPGRDPGDVSRRESPYAALNTPVGEPDPTEWPDPYDKREDPRAPADAMVFPGEHNPGTPVGATSTSDPHPDDDIQAPQTNAPDRDVMDE
jgi:hypothetical protein